jgi:hypothetical protein
VKPSAFGVGIANNLVKPSAFGVAIANNLVKPSAFGVGIANKLGAGKIGISESRCLGRCEHGPVAVVYPDNIWYQYIDEDVSGVAIPFPAQNNFMPPPEPVDSIFGVLEPVFFP